MNSWSLISRSRSSITDRLAEPLLHALRVTPAMSLAPVRVPGLVSAGLREPESELSYLHVVSIFPPVKGTATAFHSSRTGPLPTLGRRELRRQRLVAAVDRHDHRVAGAASFWRNTSRSPSATSFSCTPREQRRVRPPDRDQPPVVVAQRLVAAAFPRPGGWRARPTACRCGCRASRRRAGATSSP